mmetsp:Transcript_70796/g.188226  ORF Transcript_70796/g.188226 Transcript_70796/m.188226 type:complete len:352 (+) Transcript_70796:241-1296(+)
MATQKHRQRHADDPIADERAEDAGLLEVRASKGAVERHQQGVERHAQHQAQRAAAQEGAHALVLGEGGCEPALAGLVAPGDEQSRRQAEGEGRTQEWRDVGVATGAQEVAHERTDPGAGAHPTHVEHDDDIEHCAVRCEIQHRIGSPSNQGGQHLEGPPLGPYDQRAGDRHLEVFLHGSRPQHRLGLWVHPPYIRLQALALGAEHDGQHRHNSAQGPSKCHAQVAEVEERRVCEHGASGQLCNSTDRAHDQAWPRVFGRIEGDVHGVRQPVERNAYDLHLCEERTCSRHLGWLAQKEQQVLAEQRSGQRKGKGEGQQQQRAPHEDSVHLRRATGSMGLGAERGQAYVRADA